MINKSTYEQKFTNASVSPSPVYITKSERWLGVNAVSVGNNTITLSTQDFSRPGFSITVQDQTGILTDTLPIIVNTEGAEAIDGWPSFTLTSPYEAATFMTSNGEWHLVSNRPTFMLNAFSTQTQLPTTLNAEKIILFGPVQGNGGTPIFYESDGVNISRFIFNRAGFYENHLTFNAARTSGTAWETLEIQPKVNGAPYGRILKFRSTTADAIYSSTMVLKRGFKTGDILEFFMACTEEDLPTIDIQLLPLTASIGGWLTGGSASNIIFSV